MALCTLLAGVLGPATPEDEVQVQRGQPALHSAFTLGSAMLGKPILSSSHLP